MIIESFKSYSYNKKRFSCDVAEEKVSRFKKLLSWILFWKKDKSIN